MILFILLILLFLLFAGVGFAAHVLWFVAFVVLIACLISWGSGHRTW